MRRLVEFPRQDGGTGAGIGVGAGVTRGLSERRFVVQAQQSFEQAVGRLQPGVPAMLARLPALADAPEEVRVEFGVQPSAQAGAVVAAPAHWERHGVDDLAVPTGPVGRW